MVVRKPSSGSSEQLPSSESEIPKTTGSSPQTAEQELGARLRFERDRLGLSQKEMGDVMGVSQRTYSSYEAGDTAPTAVSIAKLEEFGSDPMWLVTGRRLPTTDADISRLRAVKNFGAAVASYDLVEIPHFLTKFSAGSGIANIDDIKASIFLPASFVRKVIGRRPEVLVFGNASGRSMSPRIEDGDFLAIDFTDKELLNEKIYAISVDGNLYVKRVRRPIFGGVEFVSNNRDYPDVDRTEGVSNIEAYVVGQVVWNGGAPA